jgi:hypothetical protein
MSVNSRWADIFACLKNAGIDTYSPSTKTGTCTTPYVVVKNTTVSSIQGFTSENWNYSIYCYVPKDSYSSFEPFIVSVRTAMKALEPTIMDSGSSLLGQYDDDIEAQLAVLSYINHRQLHCKAMN